MKLQFDKSTMRMLMSIGEKLHNTIKLSKYPDIMVKNIPVCNDANIKQFKDFSTNLLVGDYTDDQRTMAALALAYGPFFAQTNVLKRIVTNSKVYHKGDLILIHI